MKVLSRRADTQDVPTSPEPLDNRERLALIQRLWQELGTAPKGSKKYDALMDRIRREADAFRAALNSDDPGTL